MALDKIEKLEASQTDNLAIFLIPQVTKKVTGSSG